MGGGPFSPPGSSPPAGVTRGSWWQRAGLGGLGEGSARKQTPENLRPARDGPPLSLT